MKSVLQYLIVLVVAVFSLSACKHKVLCVDQFKRQRINVVFDWSKAPEVPVSMPDLAVKEMEVFLFPENGGDPLRFYFSNIVGGEVMVPAGNYKGICYNSDSDYLLFGSDNSFEDLELYTRLSNVLEPMEATLSHYRTLARVPLSLTTKVEAGMNSEVRVAPDSLYTDSQLGLRVLENIPTQTLYFYPKRVTPRYTVEIRNVKNLKYALDMNVLTSNLTGGVKPSDGTQVYRNITVPAKARKKDGSIIMSSFFTFGVDRNKVKDHTIMLYVVRKIDGEFLKFRFDSKYIKDQIYKAKDPMNVHIILDANDADGGVVDIGVPVEPKDKSPFEITIDDWEEGENVSIMM